MKNVNINEDFLFRYFAGKASKEEIQLLSGWLDEDAANRNYFNRLKNFYIETRAFVTRDPAHLKKAYYLFNERITGFEKQKSSEKSSRTILLRNRFLRYAGIFLLIM